MYRRGPGDEESDGLVRSWLEIHEAIKELKELRASLISAAVTGKIDVRDAA